ncbi:FadR/GntR family transcriptional regulator [Kineococcus sp. SYSU DK001]|uniref:FadR/GntR family transcriptional regulator n=1 Tax=Kineococcus sp. SYSU DK001 TaxID=3383122 RepID=UPI003D7CE9BE
MPAFRSDDPTLVQMELKAVPRGSAVSEVVRQLTTLLSSGQFAPGSRLPPERQLAETLGVGRSAVREALAALDVLGIVTVRPGSGTYLRDSMSELLPTTLSWGLMLSARHTSQLSEVRSALEVHAAALAAERIGDEDVRALRESLAQMEASLDDLPAFIEADAHFHVTLARTSGNDVLADLLQTTRSLLRLWVDRGLRRREQAEVACREHRAVLDAVAARDPQAAQAAMRTHMATAGDRVEHADETPPS